MRSTAHLTKEQMRELMFRPMTPEETARMRQIDREDAWLFALAMLELEREEKQDEERSTPN